MIFLPPASPPRFPLLALAIPDPQETVTLVGSVPHQAMHVNSAAGKKRSQCRNCSAELPDPAQVLRHLTAPNT